MRLKIRKRGWFIYLALRTGIKAAYSPFTFPLGYYVRLTSLVFSACGELLANISTRSVAKAMCRTTHNVARLPTGIREIHGSPKLNRIVLFSTNHDA